VGILWPSCEDGIRRHVSFSTSLTLANRICFSDSVVTADCSGYNKLSADKLYANTWSLAKAHGVSEIGHRVWRLEFGSGVLGKPYKI
jgi:hypothetical protein